jgi:cytochrome c biogenesis protein
MPPRDSVRRRTEARLTGTVEDADLADADLEGTDLEDIDVEGGDVRGQGVVGGDGAAGPGGRGAGPARRRGPLTGLVGIGRLVWRQLTSMRTALILLFLLALASLPGALLPQWYLNTAKTAQYILDHPFIGPILNKLGFLDVFSSPWYSAIYLLLAISLVGCLAPRTVEFAKQWRAKPVRTPRNLSRLPHHDTVTVDGDPDQVAERIRAGLRRKGIGGWRTVVRREPGAGSAAAVTVSAERGYLREVGNLLFHFSVLGLLAAMAIGSLFGYSGSLLVTAGDGFCSAAPVSYDNFRPGRMVDGTDMAPFCVDVTAFHAEYTPAGMARSFAADLKVQSGADLDTSRWIDHVLHVNEPLRIAGQRLYLLGHGYVPEFTVRYPDGSVRKYSAPFQQTDAMFTSQGVVKITDPPGYTGTAARTHQLAIVGIFAPSGVINDGVLTSAYPEMLAPAVAVEIYQGDLGLDSGQAQNVFSLDNDQVDKGLLVSQGRANLTVGQSFTLDDGTEVTFAGAKEYVSLQTSYDPAQGWALVFAIGLVVGLLGSLTIKRRRVWYRVRAASGAGPTLGADSAGGARSVVEVGGLARTDQAGYGAEFSSLVALAGDADGEDDARGGTDSHSDSSGAQPVRMKG